MKDELFDSKIKELVDSCAETPSPEVWDRIEAGLDRGLRLRRAWRRVAYWSSAAAVAVGLSAVALMRQPDVPARHQEADVLAEVTAPQEYSAPVSEVLAAEVPAMETQPLQSVPVIKSGVVKQNPSSLPSVTAVRQRKVLSEPETLSEHGAARIPSIYDQTRDMDYVAMAQGAPDAAGKKKPSFSIAASGDLSPTSATGNVDFSQPSYSWGASGTSEFRGIVPASEPRHYFPVSVGLELKYSFLNDRLGVGLGLNYTFLNSSYEALVDRMFQASVEQSVHYLGVPLNFYVNILSGNRLSFYANVGGMVEKAVKVSYDMTDAYDVKYRRDGNVAGVQWSANVGLGLEYRFLDFMGVFVDPRLTYFFDCGQPYSVRTEQPLQFNLELGFRFHVGA